MTAPDRQASQAVRDSISGYERRAEVLRQIHGHKATVAQRWEAAYLVVTVFVATVVTALGFAGTDRIASVLPTWLVSAEDANDVVALAFSLAVLIILLLTLIGLVYRYGERANQHFRSVEILTEFIRDAADAIVMHDAGLRPLAATDLDLARVRYKGILGALPANTDREYLRAKHDAWKKRRAAQHVSGVKSGKRMRFDAKLKTPASDPADRSRAEALARIIDRDDARVVALRAVEKVFGEKGWIIGGFIRESVWDAQSNAPILPPLHEIDVSYFDSANPSKAVEHDFEARLRSEVSNLDWSVKNQARMHVANGHVPYVDVVDALQRAPETASAVAVQLSGSELRVLAPLGLADLFEIKLRRSDLADPAAFDARQSRIADPGRWPTLTRIDAAGGT